MTEEYQNDYDSDDSMARRDHLRHIEAELQQMRVERDRYQRDFKNLQDSGPPPTRTPTLAEMANNIKYTVYSTHCRQIFDVATSATTSCKYD